MLAGNFRRGKAAFRSLFYLALASLALASCSANATREYRSEPEIFRVGELEVRLYSDRQQMLNSLPPLFTLLAATRVGNDQIQVSGYFDKENKRIYAINDAKTVIHEFKHYLEPEWKHGPDSPQPEKTRSLTTVRSMPLPGNLAQSQSSSRAASAETEF